MSPEEFLQNYVAPSVKQALGLDATADVNAVVEAIQTTRQPLNDATALITRVCQELEIDYTTDQEAIAAKVNEYKNAVRFTPEQKEQILKEFDTFRDEFATLL